MTEPERRPGYGPGELYKVGWAFYLLVAVAGIVWVGIAHGDIPLELFFNFETWPVDLALGAAAAALLSGGWALARRGLSLARRLEAELVEVVGALDPSEATALAILSGFAEELFFRGAVQGSLGWPLATALFALMHVGRTPALRLWGVFALAAGVILALLMEWRGNLLAPVVAHVLVNAVGLHRLRREGEADTA